VAKMPSPSLLQRQKERKLVQWALRTWRGRGCWLKSLMWWWAGGAYPIPCFKVSSSCWRLGFSLRSSLPSITARLER